VRSARSCSRRIEKPLRSWARLEFRDPGSSALLYYLVA